MKISNQITIFLILLSLLLGVDKTGTSAAKFLSIGSGAKAVGMGGAYTSIADDASSMYGNPAGIARIDKMELYIDHSNWLVDIQYDYTGFILPLINSSALGLNFTSLSVNVCTIKYLSFVSLSLIASFSDSKSFFANSDEIP